MKRPSNARLFARIELAPGIPRYPGGFHVALRANGMVLVTTTRASRAKRARHAARPNGRGKGR